MKISVHTSTQINYVGDFEAMCPTDAPGRGMIKFGLNWLSMVLNLTLKSLRRGDCQVR